MTAKRQQDGTLEVDPNQDQGPEKVKVGFWSPSDLYKLFQAHCAARGQTVTDRTLELWAKALHGLA